MNRQVKELNKKIEEALIFIRCDEELGCGFAPEGAYDSTYKQISEWENEISRIRGFKNSHFHYEYEQSKYYGYPCMFTLEEIRI